MRKISHHAAPALIAGALSVSPAAAQEQAGTPIIVPSQSSIYNQNSLSLPTPPVAHGQDIVRGATGVSCQSAISNGGAYFDMGVIGSQDVFNRDTAAVYGRVVIPLGERPKRLDCSKLYDLEITRLKLELDLLRLGLPVSQAIAGQTAFALPAPAAPAAAAVPARHSGSLYPPDATD